MRDRQVIPEDEFEVALQRYERAVSEYKIAWSRYVEAVGLDAAQVKLDEAMNRICRLDQISLVVVSQEEVERRAASAVPVVDADIHMSPDIYAHRPEYEER